MMEFIIFLNSSEKEILKLVKEANYGIEENTPLCLVGEKFFGFLKKRQKKIVICTENAKKYGGYNFTKDPESRISFTTGLMIRRAVRHESVHVAQECNGGNLISLAMKGKLKISPYKVQALNNSTGLTGEFEKEYEAYAMEDKPRKIISALKKYCFN